MLHLLFITEATSVIYPLCNPWELKGTLQAMAFRKFPRSTKVSQDSCFLKCWEFLCILKGDLLFHLYLTDSLPCTPPQDKKATEKCSQVNQNWFLAGEPGAGFKGAVLSWSWRKNNQRGRRYFRAQWWMTMNNYSAFLFNPIYSPLTKYGPGTELVLEIKIKMKQCSWLISKLFLLIGI